MWKSRHNYTSYHFKCLIHQKDREDLSLLCQGINLSKGRDIRVSTGWVGRHEDDEDDRRVPGRARLSVASASAPTCWHRGRLVVGTRTRGGGTGIGKCNGCVAVPGRGARVLVHYLPLCESQRLKSPNCHIPPSPAAALRKSGTVFSRAFLLRIISTFSEITKIIICEFYYIVELFYEKLTFVNFVFIYFALFSALVSPWK